MTISKLSKFLFRDPPDASGFLSRVERAMEAALPTGRGGEMAREHLATGGRRLRARLVQAAAAAMGAEAAQAISWAAAVELLHNATLVHDDIQDGDRTRRGRPTTWVSHGTAQAINVGDLLLMAPLMAVAQADCPDATRWHLSRCLAARALEVVRGQVADLDQQGRISITWPDYLRMVTEKTGGLMALAVEGAALLAGHPPAQARSLGDAFLPLGVLFQMQDDVCDLYGNKGRGQVGADLYEGKVSALVIAHLARWPQDRAWMEHLLQLPRAQTPQAAVADTIQRLQRSGAFKDVLNLIQALAVQPRQDPALQDVPALVEVADALAAVATAPIAHLLED